ncbi:MAG: hypothetical protein ABW137_34535 [Mycobacterium sp.]
MLPQNTCEDALITLCPLGCGLQTGAGAAFNVLRPTLATVLVVTGAGAFELAAVLAAATTSVEKIVVVDRIRDRLDLDRSPGATDAFRRAGDDRPGAIPVGERSTRTRPCCVSAHGSSILPNSGQLTHGANRP